jgi:hypothetical protein
VLHAFLRQPEGKSPRSLTLGRDGQLYGLTSELYVGHYARTAFRLTLDGTFTVLHKMEFGDDEYVETHGMTEGVDGHFYWPALAGIDSIAYQLRIVP